MIDRLLAFAPLRRLIWREWYPYITRRLRGGEEVLFLNYAYEEEPRVGLTLSADDEPNRACIQLYHHVAAQADLRGRKVLEVSCGHGGGASYLARTFEPALYTALDLNQRAIRFCQRRHKRPALDFVQGDAEHLPFGDAQFDAVINVEASHCYPSFPAFLREVRRVLRPGGHFLYADFRFAEGVAEWERDLAQCALELRQTRVINPEVLRGMEVNSARSARLVETRLPWWLRGLGRDFAGISGSRVHAAVKQGMISYRSFHYVKPLGGS